MKAFAFLLLLMASSFAHADESVQLDQLELIGRGVISRATGDGLVLACTQRTLAEQQISYCSEARFVIFNESKAKFVGGSIKLEMPSSSEKKSIKKQLRRFFKDRETSEVRNRRDRYFQKFAFLEGAGVAVLAFTITNPITGLIVIVGGTAVLNAIMTSKGVVKAFVVGTGTTVTLTDQNEWNWSIRPKKISHENFEVLLSQVKAK